MNERIAPAGQFRVVADANFGGPVWGSRIVGDFATLDDARRAVREAGADPNIRHSIYDDQGRELS
jgi:hypothetical protein